MRRLIRDERGSIVVLFALTLPIMLGVLGLALDVLMAQSQREKLQTAADQAAVAAAAQADPSRRQAAAERIFAANIAEEAGLEGARVTRINVDVSRGTVDVDAELASPTYFAKLFGLDQWTLRVSSGSIASSGNIEVAMSLDVTGSMGSKVTGASMTKLRAMQLAATTLVNTLLPDAAARARITIGAVAFNELVNIGTARSDWVLPSTLTSTALGGLLWNGCVRERNNTDLLQDTPPTTTRFSSAQSLPWSPSSRYSPPLCSSASALSPTSDPSRLNNWINALTARGGTRVDVGTVWAWRLLSPRWRALWDSPVLPRDNGPSVRKIAIILTDGKNEPTSGTGVSATQADSILSATCTRMKNAGITVYTVGFEVPTAAKTLLRNCASSPAEFFDAPDNATLQAAFQMIARNINNIRLRR
jgi:Flp pilus assembly protein TadG